jgi:multiple antibiotic resistance protein
MNSWIDYLGSLIGIVLFGSLLYLCLALGETLLALLGQNGFGAVNRILGFFILAIAVQLIAIGSLSLLKQTFPAGR